MKVICIDKRNDICVTVGKTYDAEETNSSIIFIINDTGDRCDYLYHQFIILEESRSNKIKELGIV